MPARDQHAGRFGKETRRIEPVQRLADGEQVGGIVFQSGFLGRRDPVADGGMFCGRIDLCAAGVRGNDVLEIDREGEGCLAVTGRAVPCEALAAEAREIRE